MKNKLGYLYQRYKAYVDSTKSTWRCPIAKPKYYEEMEEIFGYGPVIYPNEVECCLEEFQSSSSTGPPDTHSFLPRIAPSCRKRPATAMDTSTDEENFIHIKNEFPKQNVVETKKPVSSGDKILAELTENSCKMNGTQPAL